MGPFPTYVATVDKRKALANQEELPLDRKSRQPIPRPVNTFEIQGRKNVCCSRRRNVGLASKVVKNGHRIIGF